jgi:hypothetical protein
MTYGHIILFLSHTLATVLKHFSFMFIDWKSLYAVFVEVSVHLLLKHLVWRMVNVGSIRNIVFNDRRHNGIFSNQIFRPDNKIYFGVCQQHVKDEIGYQISKQ